jgi:hypothetical protein
MSVFLETQNMLRGMITSHRQDTAHEPKTSGVLTGGYHRRKSAKILLNLIAVLCGDVEPFSPEICESAPERRADHHTAVLGLEHGITYDDTPAIDGTRVYLSDPYEYLRLLDIVYTWLFYEEDLSQAKIEGDDGIFYVIKLASDDSSQGISNYTQRTYDLLSSLVEGFGYNIGGADVLITVAQEADEPANHWILVRQSVYDRIKESESGFVVAQPPPLPRESASAFAAPLPPRVR